MTPIDLIGLAAGGFFFAVVACFAIYWAWPR